MDIRTSDGGTITIEAIGGKVLVSFTFGASNGEVSLALTHARAIAGSLDKIAPYLPMFPALKARTADIKAFVDAFKKVAG